MGKAEYWLERELMDIQLRSLLFWMKNGINEGLTPPEGGEVPEVARLQSAASHKKYWQRVKRAA